MLKLTKTSTNTKSCKKCLLHYITLHYMHKKCIKYYLYQKLILTSVSFVHIADMAYSTLNTCINVREHLKVLKNKNSSLCHGAQTPPRYVVINYLFMENVGANNLPSRITSISRFTYNNSINWLIKHKPAPMIVTSFATFNLWTLSCYCEFKIKLKFIVHAMYNTHRLIYFFNFFNRSKRRCCTLAHSMP